MAKLFKISPRDYGSLYQLFTRLGRLPKARKPKEEMHACQDALLTLYIYGFHRDQKEGEPSTSTQKYNDDLNILNLALD